MDLDATIVIAHSEKQLASPTWKTFGFHPMTAWADHGADGSGEPRGSLTPTARNPAASGIAS